MKAATQPAESGSLRPYFFGSILTHCALVFVAPFLLATSHPRPLVAEDEGDVGWPEELPETAAVQPPEPETADPTPPPIEPDPTVDMADVTPPPVATPAPVTAPRVVPPPNARRPSTSAPRGSGSARPGPANPSAKPGTGGSGIHSPKPAYPYAARKFRLTGVGTVVAWTDPTGRVIRCEVRGLPGILADFTQQYVQANWRGPAGAQFSREIEYRLE
ncbi:MAG: hypothetical protein JSR82_06350 [Verrucomicrobia bacterium]|nr:hypothetical protein [Verrucomicrobiota bacterium]